MGNRLFVLGLACLFASPVAAQDNSRADRPPAGAAQHGACLAAPDYPCLIAYARATAGRIEDARRKAGALARIASAQARAGDPKGARATLEAAFATAGKIVGAEAKAWTLRGIANAEARAGDPQGARATAETIEHAGARASALAGIAGSLAGRR